VTADAAACGPGHGGRQAGGGGTVLRGLRRAVAADVDSVTRMQQAAYAPNRAIIGREPLPLCVDYADVIAEKEVWLAERHGAIAGVLVLELRPDEIHVWNVSVAPAAQGSGLGNDLLGAAEERARQRGVGWLSLLTSDRLTRNIAWYLRRGYAIERTEDLADRRIVHMRKPL
jgi:ribosomal protein S18 acetylase RimI-like enzyme